mgnify:CR=1 FL=1
MDTPQFVVSEVEYQPIRPRGGLLGFVSLLLNQSLRLSGIAIYSRLDGGIRLVFPEKALPHGAIVELICPITRQCGELLTKAVETHIDQLEAKAGAITKMRSGGVEDGNSPGLS